ncbi:hypothetical protein N658DRAFT_509632 [Parathielavia hyrcaniae]|uniref:Uncharacterized protein n=1 Tax=Parathielavia hyrcaniae TaxID=113614 RepID=A0AAN6SYQ2_9PEZI|nr:hypothetical protein N658DRAFT_509632 [Parathielavia hyrcaniae]
MNLRTPRAVATAAAATAAAAASRRVYPRAPTDRGGGEECSVLASHQTDAPKPKNTTATMRSCLEFFCVLGPKKADEPPPTPPNRATTTTTTTTAAAAARTTTTEANKTMGLITMTYPDANLNQPSNQPLGRVPARRSSARNPNHPGPPRMTHASTGANQRRVARVPTTNPNHALASIDEVLETTVGNPSEKDFAAQGIAVRDFGAEAAAAARHEIKGEKRLRELGGETPGYEHDGEPVVENKGKGKEKEVVMAPVEHGEDTDKGKDKEVAAEVSTWKGKGMEVIRKSLLEDSVNGEEAWGDGSESDASGRNGV